MNSIVDWYFKNVNRLEIAVVKLYCRIGQATAPKPSEVAAWQLIKRVKVYLCNMQKFVRCHAVECSASSYIIHVREIIGSMQHESSGTPVRNVFSQISINF